MAQTIAPFAGVVLVAAVIWEVFEDLFHPSQRGALSDWIGRGLFSLMRRRRTLLPLAGPLTVVAVIGTWVLLLGLGFALIYYDAFPQHFRTNSGAVPPVSPRWLPVLDFSYSTLVTLGYGNLLPQPPSLQMTANLEALLGFGLLTASVSSIVLLYPALSRMRLLARSVSQICRAERQAGVSVAATESDVVLAGLARDVTNTRIDLLHFPVIYYFAAGDPAASLAPSMGDLVRFARDGLAVDRPAHVRLAAGTLDQALTDLAALVALRFVDAPKDDRDAVFEAFALDHQSSSDQ
jgi:hypothetical protein